MKRSIAVALVFLSCGEGSPKTSTDEGREVQAAVVGDDTAPVSGSGDAGVSPMAGPAEPAAGLPDVPATGGQPGPVASPGGVSDPVPAIPPVATTTPITDAGQPTAPAPVPTPEPVPDSTPDAGQGVIAEPEVDAGPAEPLMLATCATPEQQERAANFAGDAMQGCPDGRDDEATAFTWCQCTVDWKLNHISCDWHEYQAMGERGTFSAVLTACGSEPAPDRETKRLGI